MKLNLAESRAISSVMERIDYVNAQPCNFEDGEHLFRLVSLYDK